MLVNTKATIAAFRGGGGGGGTQTYSNATDYTISDNATVDSPVTVSGRSGNAPEQRVGDGRTSCTPTRAT